MSSHYGRIFTGFLVVLLDFNIGPVDIIHDALGYAMIMEGLGGLYEATGDQHFKYARYISLIQLLISIVSTFMPKVETEQLTLPVYVYLMVVSILSALLVFWIYQGATAHTMQHGMDDISEKLFTGMEVYGVCMFIIIAAQSLMLNVPVDYRAVIVVGSAIVGILLQIYFLVQMNHLKKMDDSAWLADGYENM